MNFIKKLKEQKKYNDFVKKYEYYHKEENFQKAIELCDNMIKFISDDKLLEDVKLRKCYILLCVDSREEFNILSSIFELPQNKLMILYYKLVLNIDEDDKEFLPLYNEFISLKYKVNGSIAFHILNREISVLREAVMGKRKVLDKKVLNHLKKSKIVKLKQLMGIIL